MADDPSPSSVTVHIRRPADLAEVRQRVLAAGRGSGLTDDQCADLAVAATEIATNALLHGGGRGRVTIRERQESVHAEISDSGDGLRAGPTDTRPDPDQDGGRGLWLAVQLCDDVDIDSTMAGTTIRLQVRRSAP
jgi:serine/threonine-protein kinase RsbW